MKTVSIIYAGPLPEVLVAISGGAHLEAKRDGRPILVTERVAEELLARGDFLEAKQTRAPSAPTQTPDPIP